MHSHSEHNHSTDTQNNCGCGHTHAKKQVGCSSSAVTNTSTDSSSSVSEHSHGNGGCCSQSHTEEGDDESDILTAATPAGSQRFSWQVKGMDCPSCARKIASPASCQTSRFQFGRYPISN
ncbi:zinc/cadmium/mercury/lead-transporting ATPase [Yersinia enterocolitica]|nr:zinc/cadmium/mercury/lead-transporting ATPase [Yersinia enterocolitica]